MGPVLLTGASGALGRAMVPGLAARGYALRLTDLVPFPDALPAGATFTRVDLTEGGPVLQVAEGCGTILHFGGVSTDRPFEEVMGPNLQGLYHVYEAARRVGARVVFASSNHAMGFHERAVTLDAGAGFRPDSYYGLSKAYGELMGRLYWDKHGVENVNVRIGSCLPAPVDARMLASYLSFGDLVRMMVCCIEAERVGHAVIWGASRNARMSWWGRDNRGRVGWLPEDSADGFAGELEGRVTGNLVLERYQGGAYTARGYSRGGGFSERNLLGD